jgi:hypothetical protein
LDELLGLLEAQVSLYPVVKKLIVRAGVVEMTKRKIQGGSFKSLMILVKSGLNSRKTGWRSRRGGDVTSHCTTYALEIKLLGPKRVMARGHQRGGEGESEEGGGRERVEERLGGEVEGGDF